MADDLTPRPISHGPNALWEMRAEVERLRARALTAAEQIHADSGKLAAQQDEIGALTLKLNRAERERDALKAGAEVLDKRVAAQQVVIGDQADRLDALKAAIDGLANILGGIADGLETCYSEGAAHAPRALVRSMRRVLDHPTDTTGETR